MLDIEYELAYRLNALVSSVTLAFLLITYFFNAFLIAIPFVAVFSISKRLNPVFWILL